MTAAGVWSHGIAARRYGIRDAGDSALLLELEPIIDPVVNARAIEIADIIRKQHLTGVRDAISTYRSVAIHFDPRTADAELLRDAMASAADTDSSPRDGSLIELPVAYGGDNGPDLSDVAALTGLSIGEVIARHSAPEYRVFMLGFLPGYAYMGIVDETIAVPRKAIPRTRVRGGSVAIAGRQTGVYPRQSPGGWQVIGRTASRLFDASRQPPSLLAPGDRVRFVAVADSDLANGVVDEGREGMARREGVGGRSVTVLRAGLLTTVQDSGRWGHQDWGVPVAGPMDPVAHRLANALVGNARDDAAFEATLLGPELRFEQPTIVAVTGADLSASIDGAPLPMNTPRSCRPGAVLRFGERRGGARAYIACNGGIAVPPVLGSRATDTLGRLGGMDGRAVAAGDRLPLGEVHGDPVSKAVAHRIPLDDRSFRSTAGGGARVRIMPGPQDDAFDERALEAVQSSRLTVSSESDRVGYRLQGFSLAGRADSAFRAGDMISDAAFTGGLQITPSGHPILLMANRQTTGGYPQIATVITADLPAAGQLAPGDWIEFERCTREEAIAALIAQEEWVRAFE